MDLVSLLILVVVLAIVWWILSVYVLPRVPEPFKTIIIIVLALIAILFLLGLIGIGPGVRVR